MTKNDTNSNSFIVAIKEHDFSSQLSYENLYFDDKKTSVQDLIDDADYEARYFFLIKAELTQHPDNSSLDSFLGDLLLELKESELNDDVDYINNNQFITSDFSDSFSKIFAYAFNIEIYEIINDKTVPLNHLVSLFQDLKSKYFSNLSIESYTDLFDFNTKLKNNKNIINEQLFDFIKDNKIDIFVKYYNDFDQFNKYSKFIRVYYSKERDSFCVKIRKEDRLFDDFYNLEFNDLNQLNLFLDGFKKYSSFDIYL